MLAEREQDKKRIQESENKLQGINAYILTNGIDKPLRTATQIQVENQHEYIIQEKINILEKRLENSIPKQVVKDKIKKLKNQISIDICIENNIEKHYELKYKIQILQELLGGESK